MQTRIRNATVFLPSGRAHLTVGVVDGRIVLDPPDHLSAEHEVDARGLALLPGVIDNHVHFRDPGLTHKEDLASGTRACALGGVTSFFEMPNTQPATTSQARLETKLALAEKKSLVNYGFYMGASSDSATGAPNNLEELRHAHRTPGLKLFVGSSTGDLLVDTQDTLEAIFEHSSLPICAHCEDETVTRANRERIGPNPTLADHSRIRDVLAAVVSTRRTIDLALRHRHPFHLLHLSTAAECELLRRFKNTGRLPSDAEARALASVDPDELALGFADVATGPFAPDDPRWLITSELCPHHFWFSTDDYDRLGSQIQMNPSVKSKADTRAVWRALETGIVDIGATDHAPHTIAEKALPYPRSPSGLPSVQLLLPLFITRAAVAGLPVERVVSWLCDGPARIWNILGKGRIEEGFDADLVLVDLDAPFVVRAEDQQSRAGWTPWEGESLRGRVVSTWVGGREVARDGRIDASVRGSEIRFSRERARQVTA